MTRRNWEQTGSRVVTAGAGFLSGVGKAFASVGRGAVRQFRGHDKFVEALCAVVGDVNTQNGQIKPEEEQAFRSFLIEQRTHPALVGIDPEEMVRKMRDYAVAKFTGDVVKVENAAASIDRGSESAQLVIIAALYAAFADGDCDMNEATCISNYATTLGVNLIALGQQTGLVIPQLPDPTIVAPPVQPAAPPQTAPVPPVQPAVPPQTEPAPPVQPAVPTQEPCPMCAGTGSNCVFCGGTGLKK